MSSIARSRMTSQGQISVPAEIRRLLGVGPGSVLEWEEFGGEIVVRRSGLVSWEDVHETAFPEGPPDRKALDELKEGIRQRTRTRHARR